MEATLVRRRSRRDLSTIVAPLLAMALLAGAAGCGSDDKSGPPSDCTVVEGTEFTLVAKNLKWDTYCLKVQAHSTVTFTVDNQDSGVLHDLQVSGQGIKAKTELEAGPVVQTLDVEFGPPGYYQFVCSIHATMEGDIWAE